MRHQSNKKSLAKLSLTKETLRQIDQRQLTGVVGGDRPTSRPSKGSLENGPTAGCTGNCWTR